MAEQSPLTLYQAISVVRARFGYLRRTSVVTKQATKERFVEPILQALGWNLLSPVETRRDCCIAGYDGLIDYVLAASPMHRIFVVVRALRVDVGNTDEVVAAARAAGVRWLILTDGDAYRMYDMHERYHRSIFIHVREARVTESLARIARDQILRDNAIVVPEPS